MKKRRNADDLLRKLERNRTKSLEDAIRWLEYRVKTGLELLPTRTFVQDPKFIKIKELGVYDFSNGISIWRSYTGCFLVLNELSTTKHKVRIPGSLNELSYQLEVFSESQLYWPTEEAPLPYEDLDKAWGLTRDVKPVYFRFKDFKKAVKAVATWPAV